MLASSASGTHDRLSLAICICRDVIAIHINADDVDGEHLKRKWQVYVDKSMGLQSQSIPRLICVDSPYRRFFRPLFDTIDGIKAAYPNRTIAVIIPELVGGRWYDYFLHNQFTTLLKATLLMQKDRQTAVINVPWYLNRPA